MYAITKNNEHLERFENLYDAKTYFALIVAKECNLEVSSTFFDGVVIANDEGLILWSKNDDNYYFLYNDDEFEIKLTKTSRLQ